MAARRYRARRSAAVIFAVAAIAVCLTAVVTAWRSPEVGTALAWVYVADGLLWIPWSAIGALIAIRGVRTQGSTMLALAIAMIGFRSSLEHIPTLYGLNSNAGWFGVVALVTDFVGAGAYLRASQLFPRPLTRADLSSSKARWPRAPWFARVLAALLAPWASWVVAAAWLSTKLISEQSITNAGFVLVVALGAAFWRVHLRVGNKTVRHRVTWLLQTAIVFAVLYAASFSLLTLLREAGMAFENRTYVFVAFRTLMAIAGCGSLAMAVFSAGAFNPSFVLRSTVVYGAAISLLLFALNVISSVAVDSAATALGLNDRLVAATLGAFAGLLLEPLAKAFRRLL